MMRQRLSETFVAPSGRSGATLVEVLMSLLVFGVGIVSVFTLFPISILQSIRATQLTNTRILYDNVRELVQARPELINAAWYWESNTDYPANAVILPSPSTGVTNYYQTGAGGRSGVTEPTWGAASVTETTSNSITWNRIDTPPTQYVVDPAGRAYVDTYATGFGNYDNNLLIPDGGSFPTVRRLHLAQNLGMTSTQLLPLFALQDSWSVAFEAVPAAVPTSTQITFPPQIDLGGVDSTFRVVVISENLKKSVVRMVNTAGGNAINLAAQLPNDMNQVSEISTVRVEYFTPRYTWMASVNRDATTGITRSQCVMFFNRSYNPDHEHAYPYVISDWDTDRVTLTNITWTTGQPVPLIREGNFVFDTITCRWYRMVDVAVSGSTATVVLERGMELNHQAGVLDDDSAPNFGGLIFMPGIVHVFDL